MSTATSTSSSPLRGNQRRRYFRNNGDGTFAVITPFAALGTELSGFAWADFDGEGVPDAAFLQADGSVRLFINLRGGAFREQQLPPALEKAVAIAAAEVTGDALIDLIALAADGSIASVSRGSTVAALARVSDPPQGLTPGVARLIVADLDNNAAPDLIVAGPSDDARPARRAWPHVRAARGIDSIRRVRRGRCG